MTMSAYSYPKFVDLLGSAPPCPSPCYRSEVLVSGPSLISPQNPGAVGKNPPAPPERRNHEITQITEGSPLSGGFGSLSGVCAAMKRLPAYRFVLKTDVKAPVLWPVPTSRAVKSTVQALLLSLARFTPPFLCLSKIPPASVFLSSHAFEGASSLFQWPAASRWTIPIVTSGTGMIVLPLYFGRFKVDEVSFRPAWLLRL